MSQLPGRCMTTMIIIAHIENAYSEKFGVPRQSGRVQSILSRILFEPEYRNPSAFRGLTDFSHLWLIWEFSEARRSSWSATVRPPRLGGNERLGVFATRSPFRPNPIGLSCVKLERLDFDEKNGPVLTVSGADLMNGTPIYDIKPYLPYTDSHPEAAGGFTDHLEEHLLQVILPAHLAGALSPELITPLKEVLAQDPRPRYQDDPERVYGMTFAGRNVRFKVSSGILTVCDIL